MTKKYAETLFPPFRAISIVLKSCSLWFKIFTSRCSNPLPALRLYTDAPLNNSNHFKVSFYQYTMKKQAIPFAASMSFLLRRWFEMISNMSLFPTDFARSSAEIINELN